jgi:hypothetical protein
VTFVQGGGITVRVTINLPISAHAQPGQARTSECSDAMLDEPGIDCKRERLELCPLPNTLPPRTSREPCWISCVEFSAAAAASSRNLLWRPMALFFIMWTRERVRDQETFSLGGSCG